MTIAERVRHHILLHLDVDDAAKIKPEARFVDDLGVDSLDYIELLMAAEEEFDIEISDEDAENCKTVADAIALIERLTQVPA